MNYSNDLDYIYKRRNVKILVDWINQGVDHFRKLMLTFGTNAI